MPVTYIDMTIGSARFRGRLLADRSPKLVSSLLNSLPLNGRLVLDLWSGHLGRIRIHSALDSGPNDDVVALAHPGLVAFEPKSGDLSLCFGQGRMQDGFGPLPTHPVLQLGGGTTELSNLGTRLQYDGAFEVQIDRSSDQKSELLGPECESTRKLQVQLGSAMATASLLSVSSRTAAESLWDALPLRGIGTSTFMSGPLVRYRGGEYDEELILESDDQDIKHTIMWPGFIYYRPIYPRGLRIAYRDATVMRHFDNSIARLIPVARFDTLPTAFQSEAIGLATQGQKRLKLSGQTNQ